MKGLFLSSLVMFLGLLCGCIGHPKPAGKSVALAVRSVGGGRLSAQQLSWIQSAIAGDIAHRGYTFAKRGDSADYIANINFWPDVVDLTSGRIEILSIEPNTSAAERRAELERFWESERLKQKLIDREPPVDSSGK